MAQSTAACTHCHGDQGRAGPDGYYPRLAGKPALYLYNQLKNFQDHRREYHLMSGLLAPLSDAYLWDIAQYFSDLDVPYGTPTLHTADAALLRRGKALAMSGDKDRGLPACIQCHGLQLTGALPATPGLVGLPHDYLNAQLGGWQNGQRRAHAPDCMADVAKRLTPQDVNAVTLWLSQQTPPIPARPAQGRAPLSGDAANSKCGSERSVNHEIAAQVTDGKDLSVLAARGAYLARIGNCAQCHTAAGSAAYAGGRGIDTPFGTVFSSNITPDLQTGIGNWSRDDFWNALHNGKSKGGRLLSPAFPYTSYTHVTRDDADALFAFLQTNAPVRLTNKEHALRWPLGTQAALFTWRSLYFDRDETPKSDGTTMERGAYLVRGLAHCGECHGQRNRWGGLDNNALLAGGTLAGVGWYAPGLQGQMSARPWNVESLQHWLQTGAVAAGTAPSANGPMAEVIHHSTQHLTPADAFAIASFVTATTATTAQVPPPRPLRAVPTAGADMRAAKLYESKCAACHGKQGEGRQGAIPALAGNPTVLSSNSNNLVLSVLYGGFAPSTAANPKPYGMPPFMLDFNDADLSALLSWVRSNWGNAAPAVSEFDVYKLRNVNSR